MGFFMVSLSVIEAIIFKIEAYETVELVYVIGASF